MNIYTNKFNAQQYDIIKNFFETKNAAFSSLQHAKWKASGIGFSASLYNSGKFLLQGKDVSKIVQEFEQFLGITSSATQESLLSIPDETLNNINENIYVEEYIGTDESGKGDFFGPLVIAGVFVDIETAKKFKTLGIKDSKKLDDKTILKYAAEIRNSTAHSVIIIMPDKYNQLYASFKNLNKLLAWGHARAIENVLNKQNCSYALSDKFGDESLIKNALLELGKKITLEQRTKGESFIAVAAASIIARAEFVKRCNELKNKYSIDFPKGASDKVIETAKDFVKRFGKDELKYVAKTHFKTVNLLK